jgi:ankyrin repeat protein
MSAPNVRQAPEAANVATEVEQLRSRCNKLEAAFAKTVAEKVSNEKGQLLLTALQRRDEDLVEELLGEDHKMVNFEALDQSGMTALHHAARLVRKDWVDALLCRQPSLIDKITHFARTPSNWSVLHCAADVPRAQSDELRAVHVAVMVQLVEAASTTTICHKTGFGTTIVHQLTSRGSIETLEVLLPLLQEKLGEAALIELCSTQVGKNGLGAVDCALKTNMHIARLLKRFGAVEMRGPPPEWHGRRRRSSASGANPGRSDDRSEW